MVNETDYPPYIYRMRLLKYPPGYRLLQKEGKLEIYNNPSDPSDPSGESVVEGRERKEGKEREGGREGGRETQDRCCHGSVLCGGQMLQQPALERRGEREREEESSASRKERERWPKFFRSTDHWYHWYTR